MCNDCELTDEQLAELVEMEIVFKREVLSHFDFDEEDGPVIGPAAIELLWYTFCHGWVARGNR